MDLTSGAREQTRDIFFAGEEYRVSWPCVCSIPPENWSTNLSTARSQKPAHHFFLALEFPLTYSLHSPKLLRNDTFMDLFDASLAERQEREQPLAATLGPALDDYVGQDHMLGPGRLLRRACSKADRYLLGHCTVPGLSGKPTSPSLSLPFARSRCALINAVLAGVGDIRACIDEATGERQRLHAQRTILLAERSPSL